mgnify:CR=1 FL=1
MRTEIVSLLVGMVVGGIFTALKLPIPAPNALSGVLGISGIYFGAKLVEWMLQNSDKILSLLP